MKRENLLKKIEKNKLVFETYKYVDKIIVNKDDFVTVHYTDSKKTNVHSYDLNDDRMFFNTFGQLFSFLKDANYIPA